MEGNKKKKNINTDENENIENIEITEHSVDIDSKEERPGIGYEILSIKPPGN